MAESSEYELYAVALGAEDGTQDWRERAEGEVEAGMNDVVAGTAGRDSKNPEQLGTHSHD